MMAVRLSTRQIHRRWSVAFFCLILGVAGSFPSSGVLHGQSLRGSASSLDRQERAAQTHDFTYLQSPAQVEGFVKAGYLVQVRANRDFDLNGVPTPSPGRKSGPSSSAFPASIEGLVVNSWW